MLTIDKDGWVVDPRVVVERRPNLRHGPMTQVHGIVVHQTGAATAKSTLDSYQNAGANGTHFLIDKNGQIYQTGSVYWKQWHVGLLKSRCLAEHRCSAIETKTLSRLKPRAISPREMKKPFPDRYPDNADSIGIELVGEFKDGVFEKVTEAQNSSLQWLVGQLRQNFSVPLTEIYRHPDLSWKMPSEGATARW
jgi:N-acetyl-anhydromuramyl-L-alanine amidase AmpD